MWKRYTFKTYSIDDVRPIIFNPEYPFWSTGYSGGFDVKDEYATMVAYLPMSEPIEKYWDDAFDVDFTIEDKIKFSSRFPKPDYFTI
jgi:hypothetical protein